MAKIVVLSERPELIPVVAGWQYDTWGLGYPGGSLDMWTHVIRDRAGSDGIPMTWVALVDGHPVGCVGLLASEMATHMDLSPWLSSLYVVPEQRGRGVGGSLVRHCEGAAWRLGVDPLYVYATTTVASLYVGLGWRRIATERYRDEEVDILAGFSALMRHLGRRSSASPIAQVARNVAAIDVADSIDDQPAEVAGGIGAVGVEHDPDDPG